jgi:hypothetical protein
MTTKLGAHVLRNAAGLREYIRARPAVVKFVGDWGMATDVPEGVLVIGRRHQGSYDAVMQYEHGEEPHEAAEKFIEDQLETYQSNPITYWEGHNEPVWTDAEGMAWYAQFEIERMKLMDELGFKCVLANFASGTPQMDLWPAFMPAIEAALEYDAILGLHEYSCPWMWWMTGKYQLDPSADQGDEGWTTLRYRKVYRRFFLPEDLRVPLVITEGGIDPLVNPKPQGSKSGTWKHLGSYWRDHHEGPVEYTGDKADYYFRQLVWYDEEMQKDDYVIGMTLFTWGSFGKPWADFDVAGTQVADKLIAYTEENPASTFKYADYASGSGKKVDKKPAQRSRGQPRVQYERVYLLLPPNAGADWARAAVEGSWDDARYTIGSSADDAGIGDLDVRRVLAVNPQAWPGPQSLEDFYTEYYPDVEYEAITAETPDELKAKLARR